MELTVHLSDDETSALRALAGSEGATVEDVARRAVVSHVQAWAHDRSAFLAGFVRDNKSLLDRLAQ